MNHNNKLLMTEIDAMKNFLDSSINNHLGKTLGMFLAIFLVSGCGGGGDSQERPCSRTEGACLIIDPPTPEPVEIWWETPVPDFSENQDRPTVSLLGDRTQFLTLGEDYLEAGAMALDEQDGDITSEITINGQVNTNTVGDYLVKYSVTDSSGTVAIEQTRIVRVTDTSTENFSRRPIGSTVANFGYLEHLPVNYGQTTEQKPPLLIYLHGGGGSLEFTDTSDPTLALDAVINNYGVPKLIEDGLWDDTLPFVVLAPQLGSIPSAGYKERLDSFVEYAIHAYDIDVSRIYMAGYSFGGLLSSTYAKDFPDKIAAIAAISPAFSPDIDPLPSNFCDIERVPTWFFHATNDEVIHFVNTVQIYNAILDNCQPVELPKLSLVRGGEHAIHHAVLNLEALVGGPANAIYDPRFEQYETSIYQWLLSHNLQDR
jgi:predicted peptidase